MDFCFSRPTTRIGSLMGMRSFPPALARISFARSRWTIRWRPTRASRKPYHREQGVRTVTGRTAFGFFGQFRCSQVQMSKHVVFPLKDLPPGNRKVVNIGGRPIVIFNINGEVFALLDRCPHQGGRLSFGQLTGLIEASEPGKYCYS